MLRDVSNPGRLTNPWNLTMIIFSLLNFSTDRNSSPKHAHIPKSPCPAVNSSRPRSTSNPPCSWISPWHVWDAYFSFLSKCLDITLDIQNPPHTFWVGVKETPKNFLRRCLGIQIPTHKVFGCLGERKHLTKKEEARTKKSWLFTESLW